MPPPTTAAPSFPQPPPPQTLLDLISNVLSLLLLTTLSAKAFVGRFQVLHAKLLALRSTLSSLSSSPHWSQNPLLHTLLPSLLSTLQRLHSLSLHCADSSPSFPSGKLLFQSDLDIAASSLSTHLHDLDLLLKSGVLNHSTAIVLSQPGPGSDKDQLTFYIRDLFTRIQIGGVEFKKKALESLLQILNEDEKAALLVSQEADLGYLISLLDFNTYQNPAIRELAVSTVSLLASSNDESRKIVFEEGGLGPLLRILETGSMGLKEKAAVAIEAITADPENGWAISAYGGVAVLIEACRSGSQPTQVAAVGAIRNLAAVEDVKMALAEEGAVPVLLHLLSSSGVVLAQEKAANCISILASSGEHFRSLITQERGLQRLMHSLLDPSSSDCVEHVLLAIASLSANECVARVLASSTAFIIRLGELIKLGNTLLQQISASLLANLSISDGNKRAVSSCMGSLVKLMESPKSAGVQGSAASALTSLLTVKSNRKEFVRDEKSLLRLVQMLDPKYEAVPKGFPVMVVAAVLGGGSGGGCRKRLVAAGASPHLQRLAEVEVPGAKKAAQRLAGNRIKGILFSRAWRERE